MDQDQQAIGALVARLGAVVKSVSDSAVATPFYESEMVTADAGGRRFHVRSYVEVGTDTLNLRRISYSCTATRLNEEEWRINALSIDRELSVNDSGASNDSIQNLETNHFK